MSIIGSPFQAKFSGPHTVIKKLSDLNYLISTPERRKATHLCHVNLLKPYHDRASKLAESGAQATMASAHAVCLVTRASVVTSLLVREVEEDGLPAADPALILGRLKNSL